MIMEYVYAALFEANDDGSFTITYPDLPGCVSEGKSLGNAMSMAQDALTQWINYLEETNQEIPVASDIKSITVDNGFLSLIRAEIKDDRAVKRTVSIPKWMDVKVSENDDVKTASFLYSVSRRTPTLQADALRQGFFNPYRTSSAHSLFCKWRSVASTTEPSGKNRSAAGKLSNCADCVKTNSGVFRTKDSEPSKCSITTSSRTLEQV